MPDRKDLTRLTIGERLWLWRRRMRLSQRRAIAREPMITRREWQAMESDRVNKNYVLSSTTFTAVNRLTPTGAELLRLARRRSGLPIRAVTRKLKVTKVTLLTWEADADTRLVVFWHDVHGYKFFSNRAVQAA